MMLGALAALYLGQPGPVRVPAAMTGLAGVGVFLTPLWYLSGQARAVRAARIGCPIVAAAAAALLFWKAREVAPGALVLLAAAMVVTDRRRGRHWLWWLAVLAATGALAWRGRGLVLAEAAPLPTALGNGDEAFAYVTAADSGLVVLAGMAGWAGAGWLLAVLVTVGIGLLARTRSEPPAQRQRALVWAWATGMATAAWLAPGGWFLTSSVTAVALTWGLLPAMTGRAVRRLHGALFVAALAGLMLMLGLASGIGLAAWAAATFHVTDDRLHEITGFLLAMTMGWLGGAKRWWLGLLAIALAGLAGGLGEAAQWMFTCRDAEWSDWGCHLIGCALFVAIYGLAVGCRWRESAGGDRG
jgi:hypothetical protein